jgi:hypothetical protein
MAYMDAFKAQTTLISKIGESNAHLVWVLGLLIQESDLEALASEALTDGSDDKKIDFIRLDRDEGRIVIAQGYFAKSVKDTAPANKAADLNTAVAWLFSGDTSTVPPELKAAIEECRTAIRDGEISSILVFYVHNLPESVNVSRELQTVLSHLRNFLGAASPITSNAKELGAPQIEHLFASQESHIEVTDEVICPSKIAFSERGPEWEAGVFSAPGSWLHALFNKYGDALFSANYRGFLGFSRRRKINTAIRATAETSPDDFWVFNNGVTVVTLGFSEVSSGTRLTGISVINGAQTTGAIGSVDLSKHDIRTVRVLCRAIVCQNQDKIGSIVRFNNTQNEITSWDQYSGDPEQVRIQREFQELGYTYERKREFRTAAEAISIEDVAQPLAAFGGRYSEANRGRNRIFERNTVYKAAFDGKKARHILFVYSLARAIDERRLELKRKSTEASGFLALEEHQLMLLRNLRFKYFFLSILAKAVEPITGRRTDINTIAYSPDAARVANNTFTELVAATLPIVTCVLNLVCTQVKTDKLSEIMAKEESVDSIATTVSALMLSTNVGSQFVDWARRVSPS